MTRYDQYGLLDDQPKTLGDRRFIGVNMRLEPSQVPAGYASEAVNMRFRSGIAETRKGFSFPVWANNTTTTNLTISSLTRVGSTATATTASNHALGTGSVAVIRGATNPEYNGAFVVTVTGPNTFTYSVTGAPTTPDPGVPLVVRPFTQAWSQVHGTGKFSDPFTHQEYQIIAANGGIFYTQPGNKPVPMTLPSGVTLSGVGTVEFTQAFDVMLMHRGADQPTLELKRITSPWTLPEQTPTGDGTHAIPNSTHSLFLQNRLFVPNDQDEIAVSDLNNYTRYVPVLQEFKINQGSADELVAIYKFNDTTIVAFKNHSVYAIAGVYGNLSALQQDELTNQFGCVARKSVAQVGKDLWFLSELGVMSITQTEQNKLQGVLLPISDAIGPLIDRINWLYVSGAVGRIWDSKYYLAVPLDDAEVFGPELMPYEGIAGATSFTIPVVVGKTYRWIKDDDNVSLSDGLTTLTKTGDITAAASPLTLVTNFSSSTPSLRQVDKGVNTAILVYDFLNQAWSGYDQAEGFGFTDLFTLKYAGRERLFAVTTTGFIVLYEEDYVDQLPVPYTDVYVAAAPAFGDTLIVNGGAVITAANISNNSATQWAAGVGLYESRFELFIDFSSHYGYSPLHGSNWSAPNTLVTQIVGTDEAVAASQAAALDTIYRLGVRFYGTNGLIPKVVTSGSWATVLETNSQPVTSVLTTRGYASDVLALDEYEWLVCDLQTWAPKTSIDIITSGVNEEESAISEQTRDRTAYYSPGDAAPFNVTNVNGDFLTPYREDYSLLLGSGGGGARALAGAASSCALYATAGGVPTGRHQEARISERISASGRSAQVRLTNTQGRMRVMAVALETKENQLSAGIAA